MSYREILQVAGKTPSPATTASEPPASGRVKRLAGPAFFQADGLTDTFTQEVELGTANDAAALDFDLGDSWTVDRELTFHTFPGNDAANGEHFTTAMAALGDHDAAEDLDAFFITFENLVVDIDGVADVKFRCVLFEAAFLDQFDDVGIHRALSIASVMGSISVFIDRQTVSPMATGRRVVVRFGFAPDRFAKRRFDHDLR